MTGRKTTIGIAALAIAWVAALAATSAGAVGGPGRHGGRGWRGGPPGLAMLEQRIERLDLSADVRAKAFAVLDASRADERALRAKTRAAHEELRGMLQSGAPDAKAVDAKVDELGALQTQQHKHFLHVLMKVGALLPEAQRAEWFAPPHHGRHGPERPH